MWLNLADVATDTGLATTGSRGLREQFADFREYFKTPRHGLTLFSVSAVWFLLYVTIFEQG